MVVMCPEAEQRRQLLTISAAAGRYMAMCEAYAQYRKKVIERQAPAKEDSGITDKEKMRNVFKRPGFTTHLIPSDASEAVLKMKGQADITNLPVADEV